MSRESVPKDADVSRLVIRYKGSELKLSKSIFSIEKTSSGSTSGSTNTVFAERTKRSFDNSSSKSFRINPKRSASISLKKAKPSKSILKHSQIEMESEDNEWLKSKGSKASSTGPTSEQDSLISAFTPGHSSRYLRDTLQDSKHMQTGYTLIKAKKTAVVEEKSIISEENSDIFDSNETSSTSWETLNEKEVNTMSYRSQLLNQLRNLPNIDDISEGSEVSESSYRSHKETLGMAEDDWMTQTELTFPSGGIEAEFSVSRTASTSSLFPLDNLIQTEDTLFELKSTSSLPLSEQNIAEQITAIQINYNQGDTPDVRAAYVQRQSAIVVCNLFLTEIIKRVVTYAEQPVVQLPRILDKHKMYMHLSELLQIGIEEFDLKEILEKTISDSFFRKRQFTFIRMPDRFDSFNYNRFRDVLMELDKSLEIEKNLKVEVVQQIKQLRKELEAAREYSKRKTLKFEQNVKKTVLQNDSYRHLKTVVADALESMNIVRNALSEIRVELFYAQHKFADIKQKSDALDTQNKGLKMHAYLSTLNDIELIAAKIAERDNELNRLHSRVNYDVHALAHLKCKETMDRRTYFLLKAKQKKIEMQRSQYREMIYQGKLKRNGDFDDITAQVLLKRQAVAKLYVEYNRLIDRIHSFEIMSHASESSRNTVAATMSALIKVKSTVSVMRMK